MKKVAIFLAEGFEEIEALTAVDVLRRADISVTTISITNELIVNGAHNIKVVADELYEKVNFDSYDMLILPGGMPGTKNLNNHKELRDLLVRFSSKSKLIGAICAAPMVLGELDILKDRQATCYPGFEKHLKGAKFIETRSIIDNNIVTGNGAGSAMAFALNLVALLKDENCANELAQKMMV